MFPPLLPFIWQQSPEGQEEDVRQAQLIQKDVWDIFNNHPDKIYVMFVDLSRVSDWLYIASGSRRIYGEITGHKQIKRIAAYGSNILFGVAASFILKIAGKSDALRYFEDKDEALAWLKENS